MKVTLGLAVACQGLTSPAVNFRRYFVKTVPGDPESVLAGYPLLLHVSCVSEGLGPCFVELSLEMVCPAP